VSTAIASPGRDRKRMHRPVVVAWGLWLLALTANLLTYVFFVVPDPTRSASQAPTAAARASASRRARVRRMVASAGTAKWPGASRRAAALWASRAGRSQPSRAGQGPAHLGH
jgi:hypothetical protein